MPTLLHFLRLLSIVVWVGGLVFFAFVLAPAAFHLLPSTHIAGIVVGGTLRALHIIGLICGAVFWTATAMLLRRSDSSVKGRHEAQIILASIMLLATAYLQFNVLPAMEHDRLNAGGNIELASGDDPAKLHFDRLHKRSERVEGAILLCGLGIIVLMARETLPPEAVDS